MHRLYTLHSILQWFNGNIASYLCGTKETFHTATEKISRETSYNSGILHRYGLFCFGSLVILDVVRC